MTVHSLLAGLANALGGDLPIEIETRRCLVKAQSAACREYKASPLQPVIQAELQGTDALTVGGLVSATPLPWSSPQVSDDPGYRALADKKAYVELVGPDGLVFMDHIRIGLYGIVPGADYGVRTHPAEELFVMLAGQADWKRGTSDYVSKTAGARIHHPSMVPHATRTTDRAFMSLYIWVGDIEKAGYTYHGDAV